jgi:Lrp/AsnC family transcriptional regulator for asnA, asnC and gidA
MGHKAFSNTLVNVDQTGAGEVMDFIKKLPYDTSLISLAPKNTISLTVGLSDIREVSKFKESIKRNKYVTDVKVEVWTDVKNMPERLTITDNAPAEAAVELDEDHKADYEIDEIDRQIVEKLLTNSMQPFAKIAREIGTSLNTVARKYKKLVEKGMIRPVIQLNLPKIGYHAVLVFPIGFGPEVNPNDVIKELFTIKDSFLMIKTSGEYDLAAFVMLRDLNQLLEVQSQVTKTRGISKMDMKIYRCLVPWPVVGEFISTF